MTPGARPRRWLSWAAALYGAAAACRTELYRRGWLRTNKLPCRVISVGNLTVGGTGKTPVVIHVTESLLSQGRRVAVLSRGYRRTGGEPYLLVSDGTRLLTGPDAAGDEPYLIARRCPSAIVAVGADRHALGRWVLDRFAVDDVVLDDGFQHRALHRDVDLLLIDAMDAEGLKALLPAGRLREPLSAAARASAILITRADSDRHVSEVMGLLAEACGDLGEPVRIVFRPDGLWPLPSGDARDASFLTGRGALIFSGIGHAASFRNLAAALGLRILDEVVYPDHHAYRADDVARLRARAGSVKAECMLTTEKDAGKVSPFLQASDNCWAVRLRVEVRDGADRLQRLIVQRPEAAAAEVCA